MRISSQNALSSAVCDDDDDDDGFGPDGNEDESLCVFDGNEHGKRRRRLYDGDATLVPSSISLATLMVTAAVLQHGFPP